jgi:hypothetical protein
LVVAASSSASIPMSVVPVSPINKKWPITPVQLGFESASTAAAVNLYLQI